MAIPPVVNYDELIRTQETDKIEAIESALPYPGPPLREEFILDFEKDIAPSVRQHGLRDTVKALVDVREGYGVYEDLRQNAGLNDLDVLETVVGLPKRKMPRLRAMQQQGLNVDDMAQVFLNELNIDQTQLREESGLEPYDLLMRLTEGVRDPSLGQSTGEAALEGTIEGGAFTAAGAAGAMAALPAGPIPSLMTGLATGTIGYLLADQATSAMLPEEEILSARTRGYREGTKVLFEGLSGLGLPKALQTGTAMALKAESGFLNTIGDSIRGRDFNLIENPDYVFGLSPIEQQFIQITDPVAFEFMRLQAKNPKMTAVAELPALVGGSIGAGFAESEGQEGVARIATELGAGLTAQSIATVFNAVPFFTGARKKLQEQAVDAEFSDPTKAQARVGAALRATLFAFGEGRLDEASGQQTLDHIIETLRNPKYLELKDASDKEYDLEIRPLMAGLKTADGKPLPSPSSATLTGSNVFKMIQGSLETRPAFKVEMQKARNTQAEAVNAVVAALRKTGDPETIEYASLLTQRYMEDALNNQLQILVEDAKKVGDKLVPGGGVLDPNKATQKQSIPNVNYASKKINDLILRTFDNVNAQENALYNLVPNDIQVGSDNFFASIQANKQAYDPALISTVFPKAVQKTDQEAALAMQATALQSRIEFLEGFDPLNFGEEGRQATGFANYQLEPELKRLRRELDGLDVDPESIARPTYQQRKNYRSYLLKLAREAASSSPGSTPGLADAKLYRDLARGIDKDLTDLEMLQNLNGADVVDGDVLLAVQHAKQFTKVKNDVFLRAFPGMALIDKASGEEYIDPQLLYQKILSGSDDASRLRMEETKEAVLFLTNAATPGGLSGVEGEEMTTFIDSVDLDGQLDVVMRSMLDNPQYFTTQYNEAGEIDYVIPNAEAISKFLQNNRQRVSMFPGLEQDLLNARTASTLAKRMQNQAEKARKDFVTPLFETFTGEKPSMAIQEMRNGRKPEATLTYELEKMRSAVMRANNDKKVGGVEFEDVQARIDASDFTLEQFNTSVRGAVFQAAKDFATTGEGQKQLIAGLPNFTEIRSFFFDNMPQSNQNLMNVLIKQGVFDEAESLRLQKLLTVGEGAQEKLAKTQFDITQDITTMGDEFVTLFTRLVGAKAGTSLGKVLPGTDPNSLITAGAGSRFTQRLMESLPVTQTYEILQEAIRNPEAMALLLEAGENFNLAPVSMGERFFESEGFKEYAKKAGKTVYEFSKEQATKTAALNSFFRNALGLRPTQEFWLEDAETPEEIEQAQRIRKDLQRVQQQKMRGDPSGKRRQQDRQNVIRDAVLEEQQQAFPMLPTPPPPAAPPVQSFTQTPQAAPNTQQRQQFAAMFPNDPISSLINQQGIASLPQAPS